MLTIYLLRHGQTAYNADGNKYCGRTDVNLTDEGLQQAERMRELLQKQEFDAIYSSPLARALNTAQIASGRPDDVQVEQRLIEIDFGEWEGKRPEEFQITDPESWKNWLQDPLLNRAGRVGESGAQVLDRLNSFYDELLTKYDGKTVLVVGHNGVNRFFMADRLGMPLKNYRMLVQENSALTVLTVAKNFGFNLLKLNA